MWASRGFVACIRRCGGAFYKTPLSDSMPAMPAATSIANMQSYFAPWPKRFSSYILTEDPPATMNGGGPSKTVQKTPKTASGKFTIASLKRKHSKGERFAMITAYDSITARLAEEGEIDVLLVGDSVGNVMLGYDSTVPVTMQEMLIHASAVTRTTKRALVIGDMPFGSYLQTGTALENAARFLKEGGCDAVKLEGGQRVAPIVEALVNAGIAVMGHIGLTPQSHAQLGGYRAQGKTTCEALQLLRDAEALERAGAFSVVLECVPAELARIVTNRISIPTIGIGAGVGCSGQVLVCADMLGLLPASPRFAKQYASLGAQISDAFASFRRDVEQGSYPEPKHSVYMKSESLEELERTLVIQDVVHSSEGCTQPATTLPEQHHPPITPVFSAHPSDAQRGTDCGTSGRPLMPGCEVDEHRRHDQMTSSGL